jgi:hypothetical protein
MRKRTLSLVAVAVALLAGALPARACSCYPAEDVREDLLRSDGAFIGTFLSERPAEDDPQWTKVMTFRVDEELKGELGESVDVYTGSQGSMCGLYAQEGARLGLLLWLDATTGRWWSGSCSVRDKEELRAAAAPLPAPDGAGPARALVGGSWGEVGHMALDGRGRTLGYGTGDRTVVDLEVCPRARTFVEVHVQGAGYVVAARRLRSNALLWEADLGVAGETPVGVGCTRGRSPDVYVATRPFGGSDPEGHILRFREGRRKVAYQGSLFDAEFGPDRRAYLEREREGRRLTALDLRSGAVRSLARLHAGSASFAVSPDGRRVAAFADETLFVIDVASGLSFGRELAEDALGEVAWLGNGKVGFFPRCGERTRIQVFEADLQSHRGLPGRWCAYDFETAGRKAWGIADGTVRKVTLRRGSRVVRRLPSRAIDVVAAIPGDRRVAWPEP